ncbi:hypothetical protein F441_01385 [Phytophthora nicotianae CJ01A1]|nr:hypothetical protein L915_12362 [Phytophthora nicotianae]ETP25768.1 hypothetical protein F441_01385 [Phytophthora nicotianae CJ01A1]
MPKISHDIPSDAGPLGRMGESQTLGGRCDSAASDRLLRRLEYLERENQDLRDIGRRQDEAWDGVPCLRG